MLTDRMMTLRCKLRIASFKLFQRGRMQLGWSVSFRRRFIVNIRSRKSPAISIGDSVFFNNDCSLNCHDSITIGDYTIFGEGVKVYDHDHGFALNGSPFNKQPIHAEPVVIGSNCWLGSGVIVLKGVTIGDNAVIGANTVVTRDVPPNSVIIAHQDIVVKELHK